MKEKVLTPKQVGPLTGDPNLAKIKDIVVGDPAISFTIDLNAVDFQPVNGIYVKKFNVKVFLNNIDPDHPEKFVKVGKVHVKTLSSLSAYFYITFGDPNYTPGDIYKLHLRLSGLSPSTNEEIDFPEYIFEVYGGGLVQVK